MTVLVAHLAPGVAVLGADTLVTGGPSTHAVTKLLPISFEGGSYLVGWTGGAPSTAFVAARHRQSFATPHDFAAAWRAFCRMECLVVQNEGRPQHPGSFLLARPGELWVVDASGYAFPVSAPYLTEGSGADVAAGAMHALMERRADTSPEYRVRLAIQAACCHEASCGGEPVLLTLTEPSSPTT